MSATKVYIPHRIFTGGDWLSDHAVITEQGIIKEVLPVTSINKQLSPDYFPEHILAPAFIDLQIYGAYEKLLAVHPTVSSLQLLHQYCREGGAAYCMPTVATNEIQVFHQCIDAVREYWKQGGEGILGLHLEGPWINKSKRGAHIESLIHSPSVEEAGNLLEYGKDVIKIITLAPEVCSLEVLQLIQSYNIQIFAGHSNARYEEAMHGFINGITGVTHLYNAMSSLQHRNPGLVGATLDSRTTVASIIADGHHVDYPAIRIAKKIMGERLFAITDAVTGTTEGYYPHYKDGDKYTAGGILSGSALTMYQAFVNLTSQAGIDAGESLRMCSLYPARVMKLDDRLGKIEKGYEAKLVLFPAGLTNGEPKLLG